MIWHSSDALDVLKELKTDRLVGLQSAEIPKRIKLYGENRTEQIKSDSFIKEFTKGLLTPNSLCLFILSLVLIVTGAIAKHSLWFSPFAIWLILIANALCGGYVKVKEESVYSKISKKISLSAKVLRDGELSLVDANLLVPGDIVFLEAGDYIPADGRLLEENALICEESAVTGDSAPMEKDVGTISADICPLRERSNMVYFGCSVTYGHGIMVVTDTGNLTELGKLNQIKEQTLGNDLSYKKYLMELGQSLKIALLVSSAVICLMGIIFVKPSSGSFSDLVLNMITLSASLYAISLNKALPRLVNSAISFALSGMAERNAVLKSKEKIEDLSRVSVIISDKTGTLTRNNMKMTSMFDGHEFIDLCTDEPSENATTIIRTAALCCNGSVTVSPSGKLKEVGDPTEIGIVSAAEKYSSLTKSELENIYPRMAEVPFDSNRKLMATINMINNRPFAIVKGSPEALLPCCTAGNLKGAAEAAIKMGLSGERAIGVAIKPLEEVPSNPTSSNLECALTLLGLFGMTDSLSRSTREALLESSAAGIRVIMVTGDHITTASSIAKELGILGEEEIAISGEQLSAMSEAELSEKIESISVYSCIKDSDKAKIVKAWQSKGRVVALTGDSSDDAPVLKLADIGCAMGVGGKDIAKGSADLVLTDNSFISIVNAIKTARNTFFNIRHGAQLFLAAIIGEVLSLVLGLLIFHQPLFSPQGLLIINTILLLALGRALAAEPDRKNSMKLNPRDKKEGLFSSLSDFEFIIQGILISILALVSYGISKAASPSAAAFCTFGFLLIFLTFSIRFCSSIYHEGFKVGKTMLVSLGFALAVLLICLLTPFSYLLGLKGILAKNILLSLGFGVFIFLIGEGVKLVRKINKK